MILPGDAPESIAAGASAIRAGALLGLPTETVYGLAADADNDAAVAHIFKAKGRPADHPLIVHVADTSAVAHYAASVPAFAQQLMQAFWPGPLTLILPRRPGVATAAAGGNPSIGLRCPAHPVAQALLQALQQEGPPMGLSSADTTPEASDLMRRQAVWGLAAPSANQFGRVSPTTAAHVQGEFDAALLILDGGACQVGIESTIIDCTRGAPVLLRPGAITPAQVQAVCGLKVLTKEELLTLAKPAPKASGTLESHYAPNATVRLMTAQALQTALQLLGQTAPADSVVRPRMAVYSRTLPAKACGHVLFRQMPADAAQTAQQLFAVLREFDDQGVKLIWIESLPDDAPWDGVRDRLARAAS